MIVFNATNVIYSNSLIGATSKIVNIDRFHISKDL